MGVLVVSLVLPVLQYGTMGSTTPLLSFVVVFTSTQSVPPLISKALSAATNRVQLVLAQILGQSIVFTGDESEIPWHEFGSVMSAWSAFASHTIPPWITDEPTSSTSTKTTDNLASLERWEGCLRFMLNNSCRRWLNNRVDFYELCFGSQQLLKLAACVNGASATMY